MMEMMMGKKINKKKQLPWNFDGIEQDRFMILFKAKKNLFIDTRIPFSVIPLRSVSKSNLYKK